MNIKDVVDVNPERMSGAPCFTGTRVPISHLFEFIESGETLDEFLRQFPSVTREQALAMLMGVMLAPITKLVRTLAEPAAKTARAVAAVRDQKAAAA